MFARRARRPVRARGRGRAAGDRRAHLPARAGRPGADRPARAAHHRQAAARPVPPKLIATVMAKSFADLGLSESTLQALRDVGYESPSPIQEAGDPVAAGGPRRDRPGADGHRQDGRVRPADHGVHRPLRAERAGARADADARAVHPGDAGAAHLRRAQRHRRGGGLRRRADPHPAGAAARRRARRRGHRRARARPDLAPLAGAARLPLPGARRGRRDARPGLPRGRREDPLADALQPPDGAVLGDDAAADPQARRPLHVRPARSSRSRRRR